MDSEKQPTFLQSISSMPLRRHKIPGEEFSFDTSEVVAWAMNQPGFKSWLFYKLKDSKRIKYFEAEGGWRGVKKLTKKEIKAAQAAEAEEGSLSPEKEAAFQREWAICEAGEKADQTGLPVTITLAGGEQVTIQPSAPTVPETIEID